MHINILIKYKRKWPGRVQQTGTGGVNKRKSRPCPIPIKISISFISSVQMQHSLCIKVTLNNSGCISIIQCLLLYGLTLYKCCCVCVIGWSLFEECYTRGNPFSCALTWQKCVAAQCYVRFVDSVPGTKLGHSWKELLMKVKIKHTRFKCNNIL